MAMRALLVALIVPTALFAQRARGTLALGAGVSTPVATSGSPAFSVALTLHRQRFASMRTGGEAGYISLGGEDIHLTYAGNQATVIEELETHRGLWYAGWVARATDADGRRLHWLAMTGVAHGRRSESVTTQESGMQSRSEFRAHATGPVVAVGVARRVRRAVVEARVTSAYFMDESVVTVLTATAWLSRR
jgi:hypothetical protein